jgi:hypothetical protein
VALALVADAAVNGPGVAAAVAVATSLFFLGRMYPELPTYSHTSSRVQPSPSASTGMFPSQSGRGRQMAMVRGV